jgi:hypothetical protein
MNFLQLVQRLHRETGRQGTSPASVTSQSGMNQRLIDWILDAYKEVQDEHESWTFRVADFTFPTISGTQNYTPESVSITDLSSWRFNPDHNCLSGIRIYSAITDEQDLIYFPWDQYKAVYKYGSFRTQTEKPGVFSIKPDKSIDLWPIPNAVFTVNGEYIKQPGTLTINTSTPILPEKHEIIVWKALMKYGAYEGAAEVYAHGKAEYDKQLAELEYKYLPRLQWGSSLV